MTIKPFQQPRTRFGSKACNPIYATLAVVILTAATGCTSVMSPMHGVPVKSLPAELLGHSKDNLIQVPLALLRMQKPDEYVLAEGDILGIYIEGVMPPKAAEDQVAAAPPVHFPEAGSDLPPSVGFPVPIRDDGTLPLPLIEPIYVEGKTIAEAEELIREAYVEGEKILRPGRDRILVSLMRERTSRVIVIREDNSGQELAISGGTNMRGNSAEVVSGTTRQGAGYTLDMPAYKNDLMHALADTGGLPGLNARNEIKILKASRMPVERRDEMMMRLFSQAAPYQDPCALCCNEQLIEDPFSITIPLRVRPGEMPNIDAADVVLEEGDIVLIEARDTEVFYTGGLLPGGQYPIPRDYDLDVISAMSIAGTGLGGQTNRGGGGAAGSILGSGFGGSTPTQLFVIRKSPCGREFNIEIDLKKAMDDPSMRILIQPGDTLILRYKPCEELLNFGLVTFFTFGVGEIIRN